MAKEPDRLSTVAGVKQVRRVLANGRAKCVYLAKDADPQLIRPIKLLAQERGVEVVQAGSMKALGRACGIAVATACAAVVSSADGAEREQKSKAR